MGKSKKKKELQVGKRILSADSPALIIAEIGINHNGSLDRAKTMVDQCADAGADAVKFQKRDLDSIYTKDVLDNLENYEQGFQYQIPLLRDFELSADDMAELKNYSEAKGLIFLCTPFDVPSARLLRDLNTEAYKIASADLTNFLLLEELATYNKPLFLSTGMSEEHEVTSTVSLLERLQASFALLHCVSSYPVDPKYARLSRISQLSERHGCLVGYSGHDLGITLSIAARALGASVIEKHVTLDRSMRGCDHKISLLPSELKALVKAVRDTEEAICDLGHQLLPAEKLNQMVFRKTLVAAKPIKKGEVVSKDDVAVKSPGTGLSVQHLERLVGQKMSRNLTVDGAFLESDLSSPNETSSILVPKWGEWGFVVRYHDFEEVLDYDPRVLEFHLTHRDTQLEPPHDLFVKHKDKLSQMDLAVHSCEYIGERLLDLAANSDAIRKSSFKIFQRVIDLTAEIAPYFSKSQPKIVFNVGGMTLKDVGEDFSVRVDAFLEGLEKLDHKGCRLLAQNMAPNPWYFGGQWKGHYLIHSHELAEFARTTGYGVCLDLSHAYMAAEMIGQSFADYIKEVKPYVEHIHISDALSELEEGLPIGEGKINFSEFFEIYRDYSGSWIPEIWLGHVNHYKKMREALHKLYHISKRLEIGSEEGAPLNGSDSSSKSGSEAPFAAWK